MERGVASNTLKNDSRDDKVEEEADGLNLKSWEDFDWADPVGENSRELSQCADEIIQNLWEDCQWADEVRQCELWADDICESIFKGFQDHKLKMPRGQAHKLKMPSGQEMSKALPEELVERILARVPFPYLFKARVLSKSWRARLSSISSQDDEENRHLASLFQMQVREQSVNWKNFCPVFLRTFCPYCKGCSLSRTVINAYDRTTLTWIRLPSLPDLRKSITVPDMSQVHVEQSEGPLLLLSSHERSRKLYVANILTRDWKELPPPPHPQWLPGVTKYLTITSEKYKLIICPDGIDDEEYDVVHVDIYDSTSAAWTSVTLRSGGKISFFKRGLFPWKWTACSDGVLYKVVLPGGRVFNSSTVPSLLVLAINLKDETLAEQAVDIVAEITGIEIDTIDTVRMVFSNVNLLILIVFHHVFADENYDDFEIVKIDLQARKIPVTVAPTTRWFPDIARRERPELVVSDGDWIFMDKEIDGDIALDDDQTLKDRVLAYHVHQDKLVWLPYRARVDQETIPNVWGYHHGEIKRSNERWIGSSFRPGLNPFVAV